MRVNRVVRVAQAVMELLDWRQGRTTMRSIERAALLFCFLTVSGISYPGTITLGTAATFGILGAAAGALGPWPDTSI